jgi:Transposase DDE domain
MDEATYAVLPATVDMRELRVLVPQRGFRTRVVLVATTLLEAQVYPKEDLAGLYRARWHAELDLRSIKQTMQMDVLRCKTPAMVRKEIWGHLLVYNLLRAAMAQAALGHGVMPRQVSLQGTRQTLAAFHSQLAQMSSTKRENTVHAVLNAVASHRVGTRPDRYDHGCASVAPSPTH